VNTRRKVLLAIATTLLAMPLTGEAQNARKIYRVGYLGNSSASLEPNLVEAFRQGMRELGYVEGKNLVIEFRWAEGRYDRFANLVTDLIHLPVDVIVTAGTPGTLAAKNATRTIPVVMAVSGDAVGTGLVKSLARPGGNVTGLTTMASELEGKRLELLREMLPKLARITVLKIDVKPQQPRNRRAWLWSQWTFGRSMISKRRSRPSRRPGPTRSSSWRTVFCSPNANES
jgi:putative ABC transport system substrate-binding protein